MNAVWKMRFMFLRNKHILLIKVSRTLTRQDQDRLIKEIIAMKLDPNQTSILVDHRAESVNLSTTEIYFFPEAYQKVENSFLYRIALVFRQLGSNERFYETVCHNKGYSWIRVFDDYKEAMNWLTTGPNQQGDLKRTVQREQNSGFKARVR